MGADRTHLRGDVGRCVRLQAQGRTVSLLDAILTDGGTELRLGSPVARVEWDDAGVEVTCEGGQTFTAGAAVVATPSSAWPHLEFSPPLTEKRLVAAREGMQARRTSNVIAVITGERARISIQPRPGHPIGAMWTSHMRSEDDQVAVLFGSPAMKDGRHRRGRRRHQRPSPPRRGPRANQRHLPRRRPFRPRGWPLLRCGQLTRYSPHEGFARPEGRLAFATATPWNSFIDGAIESGLRAARDVREILPPGLQARRDEPGAR